MSRISNAQAKIPTGKEDTAYLDTTKLVRSVFGRGVESQSGTVTGTGAAIEVALDFDPAEVTLMKVAGTGAPITMEKHPGMATDTALKTVAAGTRTVAPAGVTLGALGQKKFTIGTDAGINEVGVAILWTARGYSATGGL